MKKNNFYKIAVFFAVVLTVCFVLYSCATMLDIEKLHWGSSSHEQSTESVEVKTND